MIADRELNAVGRGIPRRRPGIRKMPRIHTDIHRALSPVEELPAKSELGDYVEAGCVTGRNLLRRPHNPSRHFEVRRGAAAMAEVPSPHDGIEFRTVGGLQIHSNKHRDDVKVPLQRSAQPARPVRSGQDAPEAHAGHPEFAVERGRAVVLSHHYACPDLFVARAFYLRWR